MPEMEAATESMTDKLVDNINEEEDDAQSRPSEMKVMKTNSDSATPTAANPSTREIKYPGFFLSLVLYVALLLAMFLVALDMVSLAQQDSAGNCDSNKMEL